MLEQTLAYDKSKKVFGAIAEVSFIKGTITISDGKDELHECQLGNVIELKKVGELGDVVVYNHDVLSGHGDSKGNEGKKWEVELGESGKMRLHLLDRKLNRVQTGEDFEVSRLTELSSTLTLEGSIYELEVESLVDFNIRIVRQNMDGEITYFYVCNNKDKEEIDLIKVIYMGSKLLEEEDYQRVTVSHEDYLARVEKGHLKEVGANELQNYVLGMTYQPTKQDKEDMVVLKPTSKSFAYNEVGDYPDDKEELEEEYEDEMEDEDEDDCECPYCVAYREEQKEQEANTNVNADKDICEKCKEPEEDCDCVLWER